MLTRDDLIDIAIGVLAKAKPAAAVAPAPSARSRAVPPSGPKGRRFWSEYEIKKALTTGGNRLTLPADAIVSPLASDWLVLKGIEVVRA